jgi:hypothetical protein
VVDLDDAAVLEAQDGERVESAVEKSRRLRFSRVTKGRAAKKADASALPRSHVGEGGIETTMSSWRSATSP